MAEIILDGSELLKTVKLGIRMPCAFGARMWIATRLFELAGWVSGTTVTVEIDDELDDESIAFTDADLRGGPANWMPSPTAPGTKGPPPPKED